MRTSFGLILWLVALLVLVGTLFIWIRVASSDWDTDWRFALLPLLPALLLVLGTWPTARLLWPRRVAFYLGIVSWLLVMLGVVFGMFNPSFALAVLIGGGSALLLLSMFAPRRAQT